MTEKTAPSVKAVLVYFKDDGSRRDFLVKGGRCIIGRSPQCDLQAPVATVSREHCEVRVENGKVRVRDLGSSNGTFRNSAKLEGWEEFAPGDRLSVGELVLTVQIDGEPKHVEPPLLDSPSAAPTRQGTSASALPTISLKAPTGAKTGPVSSVGAPGPAKPGAPAKAGSPPATPAPSAGDPDDSDIADLLASRDADGSSSFDFDFDLDDGGPKR